MVRGILDDLGEYIEQHTMQRLHMLLLSDLANSNDSKRITKPKEYFNSPWRNIRIHNTHK